MYLCISEHDVTWQQIGVLSQHGARACTGGNHTSAAATAHPVWSPLYSVATGSGLDWGCGNPGRRSTGEGVVAKQVARAQMPIAGALCGCMEAGRPWEGVLASPIFIKGSSSGSERQWLGKKLFHFSLAPGELCWVKASWPLGME